jgi:MULE transposase domain
MDATYKTDRFNMPLVDTVSTNSRNRTFFVSFAFIFGESDLDYEWAT